MLEVVRANISTGVLCPCHHKLSSSAASWCQTVDGQLDRQTWRVSVTFIDVRTFIWTRSWPTYQYLMVHFRFSAAVVMSAVYDYEPSPQNDSMVSILKNYIRASVPGMALAKIDLIKAFPFCTCMLLIEETTLLKLYGKSTTYTRVASWVMDQKWGQWGIWVEEQDGWDTLLIRQGAHGKSCVYQRAKVDMITSWYHRNPKTTQML